MDMSLTSITLTLNEIKRSTLTGVIEPIWYLYSGAKISNL